MKVSQANKLQLFINNADAFYLVAKFKHIIVHNTLIHIFEGSLYIAVGEFNEQTLYHDLLDVINEKIEKIEIVAAYPKDFPHHFLKASAKLRPIENNKFISYLIKDNNYYRYVDKNFGAETIKIFELYDLSGQITLSDNSNKEYL